MGPRCGAEGTLARVGHLGRSLPTTSLSRAGRPGGRTGSDLPPLLTQHQEEPVERLAGDVAIRIDALRPAQGTLLEAPDELGAPLVGPCRHRAAPSPGQEEMRASHRCRARAILLPQLDGHIGDTLA